LKSEDELQSYFIKRIEKFLAGKGKRLVGWDEILEGGLAPNATVMSWRGTIGGIEAAKSGHDVVMSPTSHCYFDYYQGLYDEPQGIGGFLPIDKVYAYEPVPSELAAEQASHVLGAQSNLWTEYIDNPQQAEYMLLPRLLALSEVVWSEKKPAELCRFLPAYHFALRSAGRCGCEFPAPAAGWLRRKDIDLRPDPGPGQSAVPGSGSPFHDRRTDPTRESPLLPLGPLEVADSRIIKARTFLRGGRMSRAISTSFSLIDPEKNGLDYAYYEGSWLRLPILEGLTPAKTGRVFDISFEPAGSREDDFAFFSKAI